MFEFKLWLLALTKLLLVVLLFAFDEFKLLLLLLLLLAELLIEIELTELLLVKLDEELITSSFLRLTRESFSACSSHECSTGFSAIMLLWLNVNDSNLHIVPFR